MKNEKHVALAQQIIIKMNTKTFYEPQEIDFTLVELIVEALSQVESESALASKVVFPSEYENSEAAKRFCQTKEAKSGFLYGVQWLRSQLTLAPKEPEDMSQKLGGYGFKSPLKDANYTVKHEPEVKAQGFKKWAKENLHCEWDREFSRGGWDDETKHLILKAYQAGQASQVRLPERKKHLSIANDETGNVVCANFIIDGFNRCLDEIARLNAPTVCEGKCEPDAVFEGKVIQDKFRCGGVIEWTDKFYTFLENELFRNKYRVEFYRIEESERGE